MPNVFENVRTSVVLGTHFWPLSVLSEIFKCFNVGNSSAFGHSVTAWSNDNVTISVYLDSVCWLIEWEVSVSSLSFSPFLT